MEKTFILGNSESVRQIGVQYIEIPNLANDYDIHNWTILLFERYDINKLLIEISNKPELSLKIALHIRLSLEELKEKSLLPILFVSSSSLDAVILETTIWSHLFATKGVYFSQFENVENIKAEIQVIEGIAQGEYKARFLDIIKIMPDETIGRHSLANIWGAYSMDKAANTNALIDNAGFQKSRTKLYFKYVSAFNFNMLRLGPDKLKILGRISLGKANTINAIGKKILLIDDEADRGWEIVLRKVFRSAEFYVINEKVKDFDSLSSESKRLIDNNSFDLYLVDLRLNGIQEEKEIHTVDFSGMKVLQKIKSLNEGNQVIIFTASNKVWNQKTLLEAGADGYYMKESPEYNFSDEFTLQNYEIFRKEVEQAFGLNYLRDVYAISEKCRSFIEREREQRAFKYKRFYDRALSQLEIAFELLKQSYNPKYLNFAYLSYYQLIEDYSKQIENFEYAEDNCFVNGEKVINKIDEEWEWELKYIAKSASSERFPYFEIGLENQNRNPETLARVSFILVYKFKKDNLQLKEWGRLNYLRNTIAAHGGKNETVTIDDLKSLLSIVELFLTNQ